MMSHSVISNEQAGQALVEMAWSLAYPGALRVAAVLGVADKLVDGPKTPEELVEGTSVNPQKLYRVLRLLATRGIFREDEEGRIELTPGAEPLRSDVPVSVRKGMMMLTSKAIWMSVGDLVRTVDEGRPPFEEIFGSSIWEYWGTDLPEEEDFNSGMRSQSSPEIPAPVRAYDFPETGTIVDVAGGQGGLLRLVLEQNPGLHGILFEQEHVLADHVLGDVDESRWELASGDFFRAVPRGGDIYQLKYITHDWDDERAALILRNCRKAMNRGGRVLVYETVIPPGNDPHPGKIQDLIVMGIYPGRERTEEDFHQLFADAGLRLTRIVHSESYISIVEGVAA
jgi:hypothetical protein